jgi:hypothetical protein
MAVSVREGERVTVGRSARGTVKFSSECEREKFSSEC